MLPERGEGQSVLVVCAYLSRKQAAFLYTALCRRLNSSSLTAFECLSLVQAKLLLREEKYQESVSIIQAVLTKSASFPGAKALLLRAEALLRGEDPDAAAAEEPDEDVDSQG